MSDPNSLNNNSAACNRLQNPEWYKVPFMGGKNRLALRKLLRENKLNTVCESANCPNLCDCWQRQTATFMIAGDTCTRNCRFCAVNHGKPQKLDPNEPLRIAQGISKLNLRYTVITCVTRDDLPDGAAAHMAETVRAIKEHNPDCKVEVLCSDYGGDFSALQLVLDAKPEVFGHNLETTARLTPLIRSNADYQRSLQVLKKAAEFAAESAPKMRVKSGIMLGLGETKEEIREVLQDLRNVGVELITIGQYLQPDKESVKVERYIAPEEFKQWQKIAEQEYFFSKAVCGPLIRSSYLAEEAYMTGRRD